MRLYGMNNFRHLLTFLFFTSIFFFGTTNEVEDLPLCEADNIDQISPAKNLLFVSTLDGQVTAIDARDGTKNWEIQAGESLLSSSIHGLELISGAHWARLVPSLSGSLYRFSGESLEPLFVSAEQLLSSSYKYSKDVVFAGGRETSSLGVSTKTGKVIYECSLSGCVNSTGWSEDTADQIDDDSDSEELVLISRVTQTVRAIEPRSGQEKWNFSVGQHELNLTPITRCILPSSPIKIEEDDLDYRVIVPEGLVCAVQRSAPHRVVWQQKLSSPIVNAWRYEGFELKPLDLFGMTQIPPLETIFPNSHSSGSITSPSVYIGMHNRQLYIQESVQMQMLVNNQAKSLRAIGQDTYNRHPLMIPWRPVAANNNFDSSETALALSEKEYATTALSILYASEYVNGNGYFLYSDRDRKQIDDPTCDKTNTSLQVNLEEIEGRGDGSSEEDEYSWSDDRPYNILVVSLWYWWKEVAGIALSTALFVNYLSHKFRRRFSPRNVHTTYVVLERQVPVPQPITSLVPYQEPTPPPYTSRYLTDFEPLQCLGRGGFGIVFEARNKIDDCNYAVKRITLPYKKDKREKVLREVRVLAKLEHNHIVRYFNAWLEEPPFGWQDPFERELKSKMEFTETYSKAPIMLDNFKDKNSLKESEHFSKIEDSIKIHSNKFTLPINKRIEFSRQRSYSMNDSFSIVFEKNSRKSCSKDISEDSFDCSESLRKSSVKEESGYDEDNDDSFIVFANPDDENSKANNHDTKGGESVISISDSDFQIKQDDKKTNNNDTECIFVNESQHNAKSQRGHRKNLSLDLKSGPRVTPEPTKQMYLYIQMQLCKTESLRDWLKENTCPQIRNSQVITIFEQIVQAVEYVHLQGLIHRDLKPSNIFFSFDGRIRVGDFGLVTAMVDPLAVGDQPRSPIFGMSDNAMAHDKHTQHVGTHLYMSPEQLRGEAHGYKVDIWSLGLVLAELLIPFNTEMERVLALKDIREHKFPKGFSKTHPQEHSLLQLMLSPDPALRPSTLGVRSRAPLLHTTDPRYHFCLPPQVPRSSSSSSSFSRSTSGSST